MKSVIKKCHGEKVPQKCQYEKCHDEKVSI